MKKEMLAKEYETKRNELETAIAGKKKQVDVLNNLIDTKEAKIKELEKTISELEEQATKNLEKYTKDIEEIRAQLDEKINKEVKPAKSDVQESDGIPYQLVS